MNYVYWLKQTQENPYLEPFQQFIKLLEMIQDKAKLSCLSVSTLSLRPH